MNWIIQPTVTPKSPTGKGQFFANKMARFDRVPISAEELSMHRSQAPRAEGPDFRIEVGERYFYISSRASILGRYLTNFSVISLVSDHISPNYALVVSILPHKGGKRRVFTFSSAMMTGFSVVKSSEIITPLWFKAHHMLKPGWVIVARLHDEHYVPLAMSFESLRETEYYVNYLRMWLLPVRDSKPGEKIAAPVFPDLSDEEKEADMALKLAQAEALQQRLVHEGIHWRTAQLEARKSIDPRYSQAPLCEGSPNITVEEEEIPFVRDPSFVPAPPPPERTEPPSQRERSATILVWAIIGIALAVGFFLFTRGMNYFLGR